MKPKSTRGPRRNYTAHLPPALVEEARAVLLPGESWSDFVELVVEAEVHRRRSEG